MSEEPITTVILNPAMTSFTLNDFGNPRPVGVKVLHPAHGWLTFLWPRSEAAKVRDAFDVAIRQSDAMGEAEGVIKS